PKDHGQRNRQQTGKEYGPGRAQGNLGSLQGIWARAQTESGGPARSPQRCGQGDEVSGLFLVRSRQLRNDDGRDVENAGRLDGHALSALSATAYLDEVQAGREISSAGAKKDPGALDQQSLGAGM